MNSENIEPHIVTSKDWIEILYCIVSVSPLVEKHISCECACWHTMRKSGGSISIMVLTHTTNHSNKSVTSGVELPVPSSRFPAPGSQFPVLGSQLHTMRKSGGSISIMVLNHTANHSNNSVTSVVELPVPGSQFPVPSSQLPTLYNTQKWGINLDNGPHTPHPYHKLFEQ